MSSRLAWRVKVRTKQTETKPVGYGAAKSVEELRHSTKLLALTLPNIDAFQMGEVLRENETAMGLEILGHVLSEKGLSTAGRRAGALMGNVKSTNCARLVITCFFW